MIDTSQSMGHYWQQIIAGVSEFGSLPDDDHVPSVVSRSRRSSCSFDTTPGSFGDGPPGTPVCGTLVVVRPHVDGVGTRGGRWNRVFPERRTLGRLGTAPPVPRGGQVGHFGSRAEFGCLIRFSFPSNEAAPNLVFGASSIPRMRGSFVAFRRSGCCPDHR
jgi:hypothetical protein